ncbi:UDP-N-acetylmuramoyl-L-alanine--D-glutamate ligase [Halalkalibacter nanhaiisediminis]|uniref:UDP-N-acetylmuramoylalanine--D-glutamate ligase n=1 Tax=Halalkalibacter nanhaiisediminis TaxID=688079 RepID=A0A562QI96_9BACI|nr:UDP-N-acetylmuramoyl-L-alanine--D-glutamate ligase [Halalkalibacter nanhaiisediminis]TWI55776.1 UDP-N-acetylmuramoylalanine--D-glutamate ligase [Halalkalibacter nanhaiisediminis]
MKSGEQFNGKKVLVLGMAKSGEAAARLLHRLGATVIVNDALPYEGNRQAQELEKLGIQVICGHHPIELLDESFDYVVKNPGIPYSNPIVEGALKQGLVVVTEIELASMLSEAEIIAITGSNGKTTTTTLIYEMLKDGILQPLIAGNIGTVACEVAENATENHVMVLEVSSFQLLGTEQFRPKVSVLLNIFDAHLDYHGTKDEYVEAKAKITANQQKDDILIFNTDDKFVSQIASKSKATTIPFSANQRLTEGLFIENETIYFNKQPIIQTSEIVLPGAHNLENILAAIGAAITMGAKQERIKDVLMTFSGVEHRLQFILDFNGRRFYNDSKATNILASKKALEAFDQPIVLLAGGLDRGNNFDDLRASLKNVHTLVTFGQTKDKLTKVAKEAGVKSIIVADLMEDAVQKAFDQSNEGDVILLSPACASWDQYKTFEERGERFINAVQKLSTI